MGPPPPDMPCDYLDGWPHGVLRNTQDLATAITDRAPDIVILRFEQFAYGRRGFNPDIPRMIKRLSRDSSRTHTLTFMHETYTAPTSVRRAVMWSHQRAQAHSLVKYSDGVAFGSGVGVRQLSHLSSNGRLVPIPSNIPLVPVDRTAQRIEMGIASEVLAVGVFGHLDDVRVRYISSALAASANGNDRRLVYIGKDGDRAVDMARSCHIDPIIVQNASPQVASQALSALDVALSPFEDGLTARRGSFAAFLDHGVPTVTNRGRDTEHHLIDLAQDGAFHITLSDPTNFASGAAQLAHDAVLREGVRYQLAGVTNRLASFDASARQLTDLWARCSPTPESASSPKQDHPSHIGSPTSHGDPGI